VTAPPWDREEFVARLRAVGGEMYHDRHPFQRRMNEGLLDRRQLRGWIVNRFDYQRNIPVKDAIILSKLPSQADRRRWLTRIIDHDGREGDEGGIEAWLSLGEAAGIPRQLMLAGESVEPGVRRAVDSYVSFCRDRTWLEAVAASLTELFAPALMGSRMAAIEKHYPWIDPAGLEYFRKRLDQAPRDVEHGLALVLAGARTREEQERVVAALTFKCRVLWELLDAIAAAYPDQRPRN
jgi:pyrroloquinoline-quinone synthase